MLPECKTKTNLFIAGGLVLQIVARAVWKSAWRQEAWGLLLVLVLAVLGSVLSVVGCCNYAKGKGHDGIVGLLGLLNLIGLVILVCLPDKHKT